LTRERRPRRRSHPRISGRVRRYSRHARLYRRARAQGLSHQPVRDEPDEGGNRARFKADERAYLDEWKISEEAKQALLARDYNALLDMGGNVYFLSKLFSSDGRPLPRRFRR
jgi:hypothetical protein